MNAMIEELKAIRWQIERCIDLIEGGDLVDMSKREIEDCENQFGPDAIIVGDFVIKRINRP